MPLLGWESVGRDDPYYKACVATSTGAGAIIGGATAGFLATPISSPAGYLGGMLWGFVAGYLACPYLAPRIKQKIETGMSLSDSETRSAAEAMGLYTRLKSAKDAVKLVGMIKFTTSKGKVSAPVCSNPIFSAKRLLELS